MERQTPQHLRLKDLTDTSSLVKNFFTLETSTEPLSQLQPHLAFLPAPLPCTGTLRTRMDRMNAPSGQTSLASKKLSTNDSEAGTTGGRRTITVRSTTFSPAGTERQLLSEGSFILLQSFNSGCCTRPTTHVKNKP